jgi:hypothetical protein
MDRAIKQRPDDRVSGSISRQGYQVTLNDSGGVLFCHEMLSSERRRNRAQS